MLRGIAGAKSAHRDLMPVWTMPGNEATTGHLTNQFHNIVAAARISVMCATYNFSPTSNMLGRTQDSIRGTRGRRMRLHVDKRDPAGVKAGLQRAAVYRSAILPEGQRIVSHTKFIVVVHEIVLLTSANFSYSAENRNVEFGLLIHDSELVYQSNPPVGREAGHFVSGRIATGICVALRDIAFPFASDPPMSQDWTEHRGQIGTNRTREHGADLDVLDIVERLSTRSCPLTHQRSAVRYRPRPQDI